MTNRQAYKFYAAEPSYFSAKVRAFFRYKDIPYEEIAPTPQVYREVIRPRTGLAFIPVVVTPEDETLQDTSDILDELERLPEPPVYPPTPVPRGVGMHDTTLRGVRFQRFTSPYTLWMVQRPLATYHALAPAARARVDAALAGTGLEDLLRFRPRHRLGKRNFKLVTEQ